MEKVLVEFDIEKMISLVGNPEPGTLDEDSQFKTRMRKNFLPLQFAIL